MQENYRGYNKQDNQWYYGDLIGENIIVSYFEIGELLPEEALTLCKCVCHIVDKDSIGKYMGTQGIYQGDICKIREYKNKSNEITTGISEEQYEWFTLDELKGELEEEYVSEIFYEEGCFCFKQPTWSMDVSVLFGDQKRQSPIFEVEILGNKTNNPELINKKGNNENK